MKLFRGKIIAKSLHYYLLAPVRPEVLLAGKYLAGLVTTSVIYCTATALSLAAISSHAPRQVAEQVPGRGGGAGHAMAYVGTTALACVGVLRCFSGDGLPIPQPPRSGTAGAGVGTNKPFSARC